MIDTDLESISIRRQCELLGLNRSSYYYQPQGLDSQTLLLLRLIDEEFTRHPFLGMRRMKVYLAGLGWHVNRKRLRKLYDLLGIEAVYPKPRTSQRHPDHQIYPYLLGGLVVDRPNQVWCSDITYLRMKQGFLYLVAIMDWASRYVLSWVLSPRLEVDFCLDALGQIICRKGCEIFNTDQGSQFTSKKFTGLLQEHEIAISMDGRGRFLDNIFIERLWRSLKQECIYLRDFTSVLDVETAVAEYFDYYNHHRPHQSLGYLTPSKVYGLK